MNLSKKLFISVGLFSVVAAPLFVGADSFNTLSEIPGFEAAADATDAGFSSFINSIYRMSIGIGAALAVIMIIFAGIQYSMSAVGSVKENMRQRITMALGGLGLLIGAFVFLEFINPGLTDLRISSIGPVTITGGTEVISVGELTDVAFQSGLTGAAAADEFENPTVEQYTETFGRAPFDGRVEDGRVQLTTEEIREFLRRFNTSSDLGITSSAGVHTEGTPLESATIDVSVEGQQAVAAAIIGACPDIPREWAGSPALYTVIGRESGGQVARPNYALKSYMDANNISALRLRQDIRLNRFYSTHCCRVSTQSNREAQENGTAQCNPGTNSGLMNHTAAQAAAGVRGYSHINGLCASAAGIGQLINVNMREHQPDGVQGFGDVAQEVCGMLRYIKSRHQTPEGALANYQNGIGY